MKRLLFATCAAVVLAALAPLGIGAQAAPPPPHMFVKILQASGPSSVKLGRVVTLYVVAGGIKLSAAHMGKKPRDSEGHYQVYLDRIPKDAYARADRHYRLASVAARAIPIRLTSAVLGGKRGIHKLIVALAKNNNVLYNVKPAAIYVRVR